MSCQVTRCGDQDVPAGPEVGRLLAQVEDWWLERDRQPDLAACRAELLRLRTV